MFLLNLRQITGRDAIETRLECRQRALQHFGVTLHRHQIDHGHCRVHVRGFQHALANGRGGGRPRYFFFFPPRSNKNSPTATGELPGTNSTMRSFPASAPLVEIVPSALIDAGPLGMWIGPCAPSTRSPDAVVSWPLVEIWKLPLRV